MRTRGSHTTTDSSSYRALARGSARATMISLLAIRIVTASAHGFGETVGPEPRARSAMAEETKSSASTPPSTEAWLLPSPPLAPPGGRVIEVSTEPQLQAAIRSLRSDTTILVAPGTYVLTSTLTLSGSLRNVGIRGISDN